MGTQSPIAADRAGGVSRVDLHCHSAASEVSRLGVQRAVGLPECATPPAEVYELAKRRGMDFVTITDHDTIAGVMEIADRPGVFVSEELTAHFRGEPQIEEIRLRGVPGFEIEVGAEELAEAFLDAHSRDPRLHLVLAGGGPEQERVRERVGGHATFLGWLQGIELARAYASADIFLFPSATDTFGQVILEAQASGLPVVAVAAGGPLSLVEDRVSGLLSAPRADALAECVLELAGSPLLRRRLAAVALSSVRRRTWEAAMERLAEGYRRVTVEPRSASDTTPGARRAA